MDYCYFGSVHEVMNRNKIQTFVGERANTHLCQFVTHLTDFADLEVFYDAFSDYGNKFQKF